MRVHEDEWKPLGDGQTLSGAEIKTGDRIQLYLEKNVDVSHKEDAEAHYAKGSYEEALKSLTEAIQYHEYDHTLFSQRSAAFLKVGDF